jgi:uncharacterized protein
MNLKNIRFSLIEQNNLILGDVVKRELQPSLEKEFKTSFVTIVSGIRRCGKSTLLLNIKKNAYYVDFDDERYLDFKVEDFQNLYELLIELFGEKDYFIFDEIQNIFGWERFVRRLHNNKKKVFVTGSNASLLSRELGTHLTGRTTNYQLYPFSFREYLDFKNKSLNFNTTSQVGLVKKEFKEYLRFGGFPEFLETQNTNYLKSLYDNIIYRDIIVRYKLSSETALKQTAYYALTNIGREISFNNIKKMVSLSSATTIREYFSYFENSYLFFIIPKFNYSLKKQQYSSKKVYCIDNSLAIHLGFNFSENSGRLLENLVFIELKRRNLEIYFHKEKKECDFLIKNGLDIVQAIQVCYDLTLENKQRELDGLLEALNSYNLKEGLLLTYDEEEEVTIKNKKISILPVWKWLIN